MPRLVWTRRAIFPAKLTVELNSPDPRWVCYVNSPYPDRYFRGFKSHAEMWEWLGKYGYQWEGLEVADNAHQEGS